MSGKRRLSKSVRQLDFIKADEPQQIRGILGLVNNGVQQVEIPNRPGYVWVRLRDNQNEVVQAYNAEVSNVYDLPVFVTRDSHDKSRYVIVGRDIAQYSNWGAGASYLPRHANQHSFSDQAGAGGDVVWVYGRQFMPFLAYPSGSAGAGNVIISPYTFYSENNVWTYAGNTGTGDILSFKPTGSNARVVMVYADRYGNPQLSAGSYFSASLTGTPDVITNLPSLPSGTFPIAAVRLVSGSSTIGWTNLYDIRPFYSESIAVAGGGGGGGLGAVGIFDDSVFKVSGTAVSFDANLTVVASGTVAFVSSSGGGGIPERSIPVYDDHIFKVTGTVLDFTDNIAVAVTGSVAFISSTTSGGGGLSALPIQDDGAFIVSGTAISFDKDLIVTASGTVAHIEVPAGTFSSGSHTHPAGAAAPVNIFDDSVFKTTGTAISFDSNLSVAVTGTVAFVSSTGGGGGWTLLSDQVLSVTGTFTISSIPNTYRTLFLFADLRSTINNVTDQVLVRFGAGTPDAGNSYAFQVRWEGQAASNQTATSGTSITTIICSGNTAESGFFGILELCINEYANTSRWRNCTIKGGQADPSGERSCYGIGTWRNVGSAIDTITLFPFTAGQAFAVGSRLRLYGV